MTGGVPLQERQAILDAAERAFAANGCAATTVHAVADQAGVAKGSIYNYFPSKEELFYQVFARMLASAEAETDLLAGGVWATRQQPGAER